MFMCFVRLLIEALPLFSKIIALSLSWYKIFSKTSYPLSSIQYMVHIMVDIQSSTTKFSVSVVLHVFRFCFVKLEMGNPLLVDITPPVRPLVFGCNMNDPSVHQFSMPLPLSLRISGGFLVTLIYFIIWTNLAQSPLSGSLTLLVRNLIVVQVSGLARLAEKNYFATMWWNSTACLGLIFTVFVDIKNNS